MMPDSNVESWRQIINAAGGALFMGKTADPTKLEPLAIVVTRHPPDEEDRAEVEKLGKEPQDVIKLEVHSFKLDEAGEPPPLVVAIATPGQWELLVARTEANGERYRAALQDIASHRYESGYAADLAWEALHG